MYKVIIHTVIEYTNKMLTTTAQNLEQQQPSEYADVVVQCQV